MDPSLQNNHPNPTTTVQNISNHFTTFYLNAKPHPSIHTHSQPKSMATISPTPALTKSQSQTSTKPTNEVKPKPHCYNTNQSVKGQPHHEDHIKRATVISTKIPIKKEEINVNGCFNLVSENQEKSDDGDDEVRKLRKGYEVKMQSLSSIGMNRGRRRSFGKDELADFFVCNGVKVVSADMPPLMQIHAVDLTRKTYDSLEKFTAKTLAFTLKKEFDEVYGAAWHCIVGSSFGSFVTHSVGGFFYFSLDHKLHLLLFKTTLQKSLLSS